MATHLPTLTQLKRAVAIFEQIDALQSELASILEGAAPSEAVTEDEPEVVIVEEILIAEPEMETPVAQRRGRPPGARKKLGFSNAREEEDAIYAAEKRLWTRVGGKDDSGPPAKRRGRPPGSGK